MQRVERRFQMLAKHDPKCPIGDRTNAGTSPVLYQSIRQQSRPATVGKASAFRIGEAAPGRFRLVSRKIGQLQVERDFLAGQPAISRSLRGGR
jgi:hypothetical protein